MRYCISFFLATGIVLGSACSSMEPPMAAAGSTSGASSSSASSSGDGGSGGGPCFPGEFTICYDGPPATIGVGLCSAGSRTCAADGSGFGPCEGQILPSFDDCATEVDEDCDGSPLWVKGFGDPNSDYGTAIATNTSGEVIITGEYVGDVDFGGGPLPHAAVFSAFVAKLSAAGSHIWSKGFPSQHGSEPLSIAVDAAGNIVIAGEFRGTVDFGGGPLMNMDQGIPDPFVVKLSPSGDHLWSKAFAGDEADVANGVAVDPQGNVFVAGYFGVGYGGQIDLGGGPLSAEGSGAAFVVKLSPQGDYLWSEGFGLKDLSTDNVRGVAADSAGNVYLAGQSDGPIDFGGGPLPQSGNSDAFLAKLDPTGAHLWSRSFGGTSSDGVIAVAGTPSAGAVVTGYFNDTIDLGGGALSSKGQGDVFVGVFSASGEHLSGVSFGGPKNDEGRSIAVDAQSRVFVAGPHAGGIDFGGGPLASNGERDIFAAKLDADGSHLFSVSYGGEAYDTAWGIAVDPAGNAFLAGSFSSTVSFKPCVLESAGATDVVVARLGL